MLTAASIGSAFLWGALLVLRAHQRTGKPGFLARLKLLCHLARLAVVPGIALLVVAVNFDGMIRSGWLGPAAGTLGGFGLSWLFFRRRLQLRGMRPDQPVDLARSPQTPERGDFTRRFHDGRSGGKMVK